MSFNSTRSPSVSILTATLNAGAHLPRLIASLRAQTDSDFQWVIADGGSADETAELLAESARHLSTKLLVERDFGIYDALNRGLQVVRSDYYLVVGADDTLHPNAVQQFRQLAREGLPDFVSASIMQAGRTVNPRSGLGWLYGLQGVTSGHAVGLLIKRSLHERFGVYSNRFPIAADQLFVKSALLSGASIKRSTFIAGEFSTTGLSGNDALGQLTEMFRCQIRTERYLLPQYILFVARLFKYYLRTFASSKV